MQEIRRIPVQLEALASRSPLFVLTSSFEMPLASPSSFRSTPSLRRTRLDARTMSKSSPGQMKYSKRKRWRSDGGRATRRLVDLVYPCNIPGLAKETMNESYDSYFREKHSLSALCVEGDASLNKFVLFLLVKGSQSGYAHQNILQIYKKVLLTQRN